MRVFVLLSVIAICCYGSPHAYFLYDSQDDCNAFVDVVEYNGSCYLTEDCSRGAFNITINEENGECEAYEFGPVVSISISSGLSAATLMFDTFSNCNESYSLTIFHSMSWANNYCEPFTTWQTSSDRIEVPYSKGLQELSFSDA